MAQASPKHDRRIHPGSSRRRGLDHPKGRQVEPQALAEVQALLGERERRRDLLIEHLHLLQDHYGCLHARHLAALAEEMRLALVEVYEVASFYAHFDIVMDDEAPPPALTVRVCDSLTCELFGARAFARANCRAGSAAECAWCGRRAWAAATTRRSCAIGHALHEHATADSVAAAVAAGIRHPDIPPFIGLDALPRRRRLQAAAKPASPARARRDRCSKRSKNSGMRGLGGAGFPTGRKWRFVRAGAGTAADGGQRRRGRARHIQGPLFPRNRSASLLGRDADRRLGGRGAPKSTSTCATNTRNAARSWNSEIAAIEAAGLARGMRDPSAPRRRRLYLRRGIGDARKHRGQARAAAAQAAVSRRRSACSAGRP